MQVQNPFTMPAERVCIKEYAWGGVEPRGPHDGLAKVVEDLDAGKASYWVKVGTSGPESGRLYNPKSPTFIADGDSKLKGGRTYEYRRVRREAFDLFLEFIKTGHLVHLRHAERELV